MGSGARDFEDDDEEDFGGEETTGVPQALSQIPILPEFMPGADQERTEPNRHRLPPDSEHPSDLPLPELVPDERMALRPLKTQRAERMIRLSGKPMARHQSLPDWKRIGVTGAGGISPGPQSPAFRRYWKRA